MVLLERFEEERKVLGTLLRDHSSIMSSKRWVGGVRKWQFLMIYSTVPHQRGGWVGLKKSKTWWRILEWSLLLCSKKFQIVEVTAGQPKSDLNSCDFLRAPTPWLTLILVLEKSCVLTKNCVYQVKQIH